MTTTKHQDFHATLSSVREEIERRLAEANSILAPSDRWDAPIEALVPHMGGVPYGQTYRGDAALVSYKGKVTLRGAHATIYRLESGTYELTFYIL